MSAVTWQINGDRIDLWTNISAWNPDEKFLNNQPYSQRPKELYQPFYCFSNEELPQLSGVTHVSVPFAYWKRGNTHCPSNGSPFSGTRWQSSKNPNNLGRLVVPIEQAPADYYSEVYNTVKQHSDVLKNIGYTLDQVHQRVLQLEGNRNRLFSTIIPLSCMGVANSITSLFPWTQITYRYNWTTPFRFIADFITLPVRLLTFLPRLVYQCMFSKPTPPFTASVINGADIDWNSGAICLYTANYGAGRLATIGGPGPDPRDYTNCLQSSEVRAIYFG